MLKIQQHFKNYCSYYHNVIVLGIAIIIITYNKDNC